MGADNIVYEHLLWICVTLKLFFIIAEHHVKHMSPFSLMELYVLNKNINLKEQFTKKINFSHLLLTTISMETLETFCNPYNCENLTSDHVHVVQKMCQSNLSQNSNRNTAKQNIHCGFLDRSHIQVNSHEYGKF